MIPKRGEYSSNIFYYGSCTSALAAALMASVPEGFRGAPEVIMPAYSSPALLNAAKLANVRPQLVDFKPDSQFVDPGDVQRTVSASTVAIVLVRLMGLPANVSEIKASLSENCLPLIEDSAHFYPENADLSADGDATAYSFSWGKPISAGGGGALVISDSSLIVPSRLRIAEQIRPSLASRVRQSLRVVGRNFVLRPFPYGVVTRLLRTSHENLRYHTQTSIEGMRSDHLGRLRAQFGDRGRAQVALQAILKDALAHLPTSVLLDLPASLGFAENLRLWRYPILLATPGLRDRCFDALRRAGLGPSRLYRSLLSPMDQDETDDRWPNARSFAKRVLALPVHSDVTARDALTMASIIEAQLAAE